MVDEGGGSELDGRGYGGDYGLYGVEAAVVDVDRTTQGVEFKELDTWGRALCSAHRPRWFLPSVSLGIRRTIRQVGDAIRNYRRAHFAGVSGDVLGEP